MPPEDGLGGVGYRHGGGWRDGPGKTAAYIVQQPDYRGFEDTGLRRHAVSGQHAWPPLAGYACAGVPLAHIDADGEGVHAAALGRCQRTGTVLAAGSTDWAQVLGCARDRRVKRIARNVIDRLHCP